MVRIIVLATPLSALSIPSKVPRIVAIQAAVFALATVDNVDGRTARSWAASRGDDEAVKVLQKIVLNPILNTESVSHGFSMPADQHHIVCQTIIPCRSRLKSCECSEMPASVSYGFVSG